ARTRRPNRRDRDPRSTTQLSLFEIPLQPPTPSETIPTAPPPTSTTPGPDPYRGLPPSNQPDALAPGVRRGRVNVAGSRAGERSVLNGNLNGGAGSGC